MRLNTQTPQAATATQAGVSSPPWHQFLTIAGALAVVNSVLIGGTPGLAVQAGTGDARASRIPPAAASDLARRGSQRQHHRQPVANGSAG